MLNNEFCIEFFMLFLEGWGKLYIASAINPIKNNKLFSQKSLKKQSVARKITDFYYFIVFIAANTCHLGAGGYNKTIKTHSNNKKYIYLYLTICFC